MCDINGISKNPKWLSSFIEFIEALYTNTTPAWLFNAISWESWSYVLCKNVDNTAHTGFAPFLASPVVIVTACSSAIPTSTNWLPNCSLSFLLKTIPGVPALITTASGSSFIFFVKYSEVILLYVWLTVPFLIYSPVSKLNGPPAWNFSWFRSAGSKPFPFSV